MPVAFVLGTCWRGYKHSHLLWPRGPAGTAEPPCPRCPHPVPRGHGVRGPCTPHGLLSPTPEARTRASDLPHAKTLQQQSEHTGEKFSLVKGKKLWFWGRDDQSPTARGACSPGTPGSPALSSARNSCLVQVRQAERLTGWLLNGGTTLASALLRGSNYLENGGHRPRSFTLIEFRYLPLAACLLARARSSEAAPSSPSPCLARSRLGLPVKRENHGHALHISQDTQDAVRALCSPCSSCCKKLSAPASVQHWEKESGLNAARELPCTIRQKCRQLLQKK